MVQVHPIAESQAKPHAGPYTQICTYLYITCHLF